MSQNLILISPEELKAEITIALTETLQKHFPLLNEPFKDYPELLTRDEVCKMLNIALATLNNWCNDGRIKPTKQGRVIRFQKTDVINLFRSQPKHKRF